MADNNRRRNVHSTEIVTNPRFHNDNTVVNMPAISKQSDCSGCFDKLSNWWSSIDNENRDEFYGWFWFLLVIAVILIGALCGASVRYVTYDQLGFVKNNFGTVDTSTVLTRQRLFLTLNYDLLQVRVFNNLKSYSLCEISCFSNVPPIITVKRSI